MPGYQHLSNSRSLPPIDYEVMVFEVRDHTAKALEANEGLDKTTNMDGFTWSQLGLSTWKGVQQIKLLGMSGRAYIKEIKGKEYIVFKGLAGDRPNLPGTMYRRINPKVSCFVVGTDEMIEDGLRTTRLAVIVYAVLDVTREVVSPPAPVARGEPPGFSLIDLGVHLSCDVLKFALATAAGIAAAAVVTALVVGAVPVVLVFGIGLVAATLVGGALDYIDNHYGLTDKLSELCRKWFWENETVQRLYHKGGAWAHESKVWIETESRQIEGWF